MNLINKIKLKKACVICAVLFFIVSVAFVPVSSAEANGEQSDIIDISFLKQFLNENLINRIMAKLAEFGAIVKTEIHTITVDDGELSNIINSDLQNINMEDIGSFIENNEELKGKLEKIKNLLEKEIFN